LIIQKFMKNSATAEFFLLERGQLVRQWSPNACSRATSSFSNK